MPLWQIVFSPAEAQVAPHFVECMETLTVNEGAPFRLTVEAAGIPIPTLTWYRDGVILKPDDDRNHCAIETAGGRSMLSVDQSTRNHAGLYHCIAASTAGTATNCARVTVQGRGYFI